MARAVLFDLDDTLLASSPGLIANFRRTAEDLGLPPPPPGAIDRPFVDFRAHVRLLFPDADVDRFERTYYERVEQFPYPPIPGAHATLEALADRPLGIVTNRTRNLCGLRMRQGGFDPERFVFVHTVEDVPAVKPDPRVFEPGLALLAERLPGLRAEEVVYVGDRVLDAQAARAAGLRFVGVATGLDGHDGLRAAGVAAEDVLASVRDLPAYLAALGS